MSYLRTPSKMSNTKSSKRTRTTIKLPKNFKFFRKKIKIKNWKYLQNYRDNHWNNKERSSKKNYQYFHGLNDKAKPILDNMKHMTKIDAQK